MKRTRVGEKGRHPVPDWVTKRSWILLFFGGTLFVALAIRILLLQTLDYDRYREKVENQITTESAVQANRGIIYDANGVPLAVNQTKYRVFLSPSSIAYTQRDLQKEGINVSLAEEISAGLSGVLGMSYESVLKQTQYKSVLDRTVKKGLDEETAEAVRKLISDKNYEKLVYLEAYDTRYYPSGSLASHVIGFTGSDGAGLYGLEYSYDKMLRGKNGTYLTARDARGNEMPSGYETYTEAENGYNLYTTLDFTVQSVLESALETAYTESKGQNRAAGIVMDVNTGAILGMGVYPKFDLNNPWEPDSQSQSKLTASGFLQGSDEYAALRRELLGQMWSNKNITDSYIPGSTFKVITAAMALEEGVVSLDDTFSCCGSKAVAGHTIHCHKRKGHGMLNFVEGIQQSCNPVLMTTGLRIGAEKFYSYLTSFGYREKTGIDLPGEGNSLIIGWNSFTELDLAIYSFGQNFNVTMIQQISAIATVANGGCSVTPHLISKITDSRGNTVREFEEPEKRQVVSEQTCQTVSAILEGGVSGTGGAKNAYVPGYRIAAKTGTSQKKNAGSIGKYVCSTVAYAPADDPQYAVILMVDEPSYGILYGSTVAAPYVGQIMEQILPYLGVEAVYSESELQHLTVAVPDCVSLSAKEAKNECEKLGLVVEYVGDAEGTVTRQIPMSGSFLEADGGKVILYMNGAEESQKPDPVTVPNLIGKSPEEANRCLVDAGLNIRIRGTKNQNGEGIQVIGQSVAQGTALEKGSVVEVTFRYLGDDDEEVWEDMT